MPDNVEWKGRTILLERYLAKVDKRQKKATIEFKNFNDTDSLRAAV